MKITHVVQAKSFGLGWVDHKTAESLEKAQAAETALRENPSAWMQNTVGETRIVPVEQSRCFELYKRKTQ
jgi:hypothetical protein